MTLYFLNDSRFKNKFLKIFKSSPSKFIGYLISQPCLNVNVSK
jgi:hypothetical protein